MANYPQELLDLLKEYLTDGIITAAERQVLLNKAQSLDVNPQEFNLYIDAQEQKLEQANREAAAKLKGRVCPYCGGAINDFSDKCPHCDQNITPQANEEVKEIIDNLEEALVQLKSGEDVRKNKANVERYVRKAEMYYSSNPKIQKLLAEVKAESVAAEKAAKSRENRKTVANFVSKHKWLTAIIILVLIWAVSAIVGSVKEAVNGPDITEDAPTCIQAMEEAINEGNLTKAEALYNNFNYKGDIEPATIKIVEYYIDNNDLAKAEVWAEKLPYSSAGTYKDKVGAAYIEAGEYEKGQKLLSDYYGIITLSESPIYIKVIKAMKKNGEDIDDIEAYIEGLVAAVDSDEKAELRSTLNKAAGIK